MPEADKDLTGLLGLGRIKDRVPFTRDEIRSLIELTDPNKVQQLFEAARQVREQVFGNRIFLYGFLYFSTHCRNNCRFCQYRKSNNTIARYRKTKHQILEVAREMKNAGVHLIDLTMGEDPAFYNSGNKGFHEFIDMVKAVQNETGSPIMVSPGSLPDKALKRLAEMGIDWYACYQETHNPDLFKTLRTGQAYTKRLEKKYLAKQLGLLIEEGILTGVGESPDDLVDSIFRMMNFNVDQARVMTFVPQANTPMSNRFAQNNLKEKIIIAVMRLAIPELLIPASLDIDGSSGLKARLDAGANVVTSIVPPLKGLAGVANHTLDIEESKRTLEYISPILDACGLVPASQDDYNTWMDKQRNKSEAVSKIKETTPC